MSLESKLLAQLPKDCPPAIQLWWMATVLALRKATYAPKARAPPNTGMPVATSKLKHPMSTKLCHH